MVSDVDCVTSVEWNAAKFDPYPILLKSNSSTETKHCTATVHESSRGIHARLVRLFVVDQLLRVPFAYFTSIISTVGLNLKVRTIEFKEIFIHRFILHSICITQLFEPTSLKKLIVS